MRPIDADVLELILNNAIEMMRTMARALDSEDDPEIQMEIKAYTDILNGVKEQPTIEERKTGRMERKESLAGMYYQCTVCGAKFYHSSPDNYCPHCGAKMEVTHETD